MELLDKLFEPIMAFLGISTGFVFLFIVYKFLILKNKEAMARIHQGYSQEISDEKKKDRQESYFKNGLILIAIAFGIIFGYLLNIGFNLPNYVSYPAMIFIFCGSVLIYFHKSKVNN